LQASFDRQRQKWFNHVAQRRHASGQAELASESYDRYDVAIEREWLPAASIVSA
jgi:hypothetical protein